MSWIARQIGHSYVFEGRLKQASAEFRKAVQLAQDEKNPRREMLTHADAGKCLAVRKNYAEAIQEFSRAEQLSWKIYRDFNPVPIKVRYYIGLALLYQGDLKGADSLAASIKRIIEQENYDRFYVVSYYLLDYYYLLLAELYIAQGNGRSAETAIGKTLANTKLLSPHYRKLAAASSALQGDFENAIETYESFYTGVQMGRVHEDRFIYWRERSLVDYHIAKIYEQQGDKRRAIEYYSKFLQLWKNADQDLSELNDARARLAELESS